MMSLEFQSVFQNLLRIEHVVLHRVGFLEYFCPEQSQDFNPLAVAP